MEPSFSRCFPFLIFTWIGILIVLAFALRPEPEKTAEDLVQEVRKTSLAPCFPNVAFVHIYSALFRAQDDLSDDELAQFKKAGRIITGGHHKGIVVPENCFAVASGLYGFNTTFWQRPYHGGQYDMSIPYWNPVEDQINADDT